MHSAEPAPPGVLKRAKGTNAVLIANIPITG
jgi:hypothetical protein